MVFEGILVDLLNRFLGPYVKNLDRSQLNIGIWGGRLPLQVCGLKLRHHNYKFCFIASLAQYRILKPRLAVFVFVH